MKKIITAMLAALLLSLPLHADDVPLVVVSVRQFLVQGDSTIHLYLYGLDGKLRKQLTNDAGQDDHRPRFSHDGKSILFTRVTTGRGLPDQGGRYILQLADGKLAKLPDGDVPDTIQRDFEPTLETAEYGNLAFSSSQPGMPYPAPGKDDTAFTAPDKSATLIRRAPPNDETSATFELKLGSATSAKPISDFAGFTLVPENIGGDQFLASSAGPFFLGPDHYGALFVNRHRDSMWAFDLHGQTWHEIQKEWLPGDIFAVQNKAGFYFVRCSLEETLGNTNKKPLCGYLEWWDAHFHPVVLGPPLSVVYGAATYYGNGETSAVVDEQRGS